MNILTGRDLATKIADELGEDCSRLCLEAEPECYDLFEALVRNVGLAKKDDVSGIVEQYGVNKEARFKDENTLYLDYYCRVHMGVTEKDARFKDLNDCIKSFDEEFISNNWRRFGLTNRTISEERAEIFICCSAYVHGRSLKRHIAEFFSYCCHSFKIKLTCLDEYQEKISTLITEELGPQKSPNSLQPRLNVHDHISVTNEIERINESVGFYPYGKEKIWSPDRAKIRLAVDKVDQLLLVVPGHVKLLSLKIRLLALLDCLSEALELAENLYENESNNIDASIPYIGVLNKIGRKEEALEIAKKAQSCSNGFDDPLLTFNIAACLVQLNRLKEAIEEFKKAILLDNTFVTAYYYLADIYLRTKQYKKSEVILRKAIRIAPGETKLVLLLVKALKANGKVDEANNLLEKTKLDKVSERENAYFTALTEQKNNNFNKSVDIMTAFIESQEFDDFISEKDKALAFRNFASLYEKEYFEYHQKKHYSLAKYYYEKSVDYYPDDNRALLRAVFFVLATRNMKNARNIAIGYSKQMNSCRLKKINRKKHTQNWLKQYIKTCLVRTISWR
ncbi:MAG: tetratricopeptide repeat protein [Candidatus Thiodiazotropha sp.]